MVPQVAASVDLTCAASPPSDPFKRRVRAVVGEPGPRRKQ